LGHTVSPSLPAAPVHATWPCCGLACRAALTCRLGGRGGEVRRTAPSCGASQPMTDGHQQQGPAGRAGPAEPPLRSRVRAWLLCSDLVRPCARTRSARSAPLPTAVHQHSPHDQTSGPRAGNLSPWPRWRGRGVERVQRSVQLRALCGLSWQSQAARMKLCNVGGLAAARPRLMSVTGRHLLGSQRGAVGPPPPPPPPCPQQHPKRNRARYSKAQP
jgi:hypothetical protein